MTRRFFPFAFVVLAACGGSVPRVAHPAALHGTRPLDARESAYVRDLVAWTSELRGHPPELEVDVVVADEATLAAAHAREPARDPLDAHGAHRLLYATLGLAPATGLAYSEDVPDDDPIPVVYSRSAGQILVRESFFTIDEPSTRRRRFAETYFAANLALAMTRATLDEEAEASLVNDPDVRIAYEVLESSETVLVWLAAMARATGTDLERLVRDDTFVHTLTELASRPRSDDSADMLPLARVAERSALFAGVRFAAHLLAEGGWDAIDEAYDQSGWLSCEHILHPERYDAGEAAEEVLLDDEVAESLDALVVADETTLGEFVLRAYFEPAGLARADRASTGWAGDRARTYQRADGSGATLWVTTWDSIRDAVEAADAARRVGETRPEPARSSHEVMRVQRAVLVLDGMTADERAAVRAWFEAWVYDSLQPLDAWTGE